MNRLLTNLSELGVLENLADNAGAVKRGVGVESADDEVELGKDGVDLGGVVGDEGNGADALAVEAKVLGKGLADGHLEALLDKVADGPGVVLKRAGSEALVGRVEPR